jgi:uncharacterized protein (TIGR01777 family)
VGRAIQRHLDPTQWEIVVVTRTPSSDNHILWDGENLGQWTEVLDTTDVVINLAGRRVHCRYNQANLEEMLRSRIRSTELIGEAISQCTNPPALWLQSSTATIYQHTFGQPNDEATGVLGGDEPNTPSTWNYSIKIAKEWEQAMSAQKLPHTRRVAMRTAIMMGIDKDSAFDIFSRLTRMGLGGTLAGGKQYVSWIHELDLVRAIEFLVSHGELDGPVNISSPNPLPQKEFAAWLRKAWGVPLGLPATELMIQIGAWLLNGDSELVLKSRRVVPSRLEQAGFKFQFPTWPEAAQNLVATMKLTS